MVDSDNSSSVLHVFRVELNENEPVEVLTLPMDRLDLVNAWASFGDTLKATHAHAFENSLAIGLRLRAAGTEKTSVRVLRVEVDELVP